VKEKQAELIDTLMSQLSEDEKTLCGAVIDYLLELGYMPKRHKKGTFVVAFEKKGRKIVKLEYGKHLKSDPTPFLTFWLRYSASDDLSPKFQEPIMKMSKAHEEKHGERMGEFGERYQHCGKCKDDPRLYTYVWPDGTKDSWCGGYTLMSFRNLTTEDVSEIFRHIKNQDEYYNNLLGV